MNHSDVEVLQYCDGELSSERSKQLLEASRRDPELAEAIAVVQASRLPFRAAFDAQVLPPVPAALRADVARWAGEASDAESTAEPEARASWQHLAIAAGALICLGVGYLLAQHGQPGGIATTDTAATDVGQGDSQQVWVQRVADYQSLYVENTVSTATVSAGRADALLATLEKRAGLHTGIPDLGAHGYRFVRAQELGYNGQPLVQLVYAKPGSIPLALCYMAAGDDAEAPLSLAVHHGLGTASWIASGQRFVLVGDEPESVLRDLQTATRSIWI